MIRYFVFLVFVIGFTAQLTSQPKYELRAVWVATVSNIDWPSKPGLPVKEQKQEIIQILELQKSLGMNTIILQVRPTADALYNSPLEPWSKYLTGTPGLSPDPFYDPLQFWIEECHNRGMELHAWLNPFRVAQKWDEPLAGNHIAFEHPEWIVRYGDRLYFDPGIPDASEFLGKVVRDIVQRYDVDAIHFDDYFYPYPEGEEFPDTLSFKHFNRGYVIEDKADWRRENVDLIIQNLSQIIKDTKPWVKFGISPFGVWRNKADDPMGSETKAGVTNYDHLYADVIKWQKEGWIDYLMPQIYWHMDHPLVGFELLSNWWNEHSYGRAVYTGHAVYKLNEETTYAEWRDARDLVQQILTQRIMPGIGGSAFFSSNHFNRDLSGLKDSLRNSLFQTPAIVPPMPWIDSIPPAPVVKMKKSGRKVKWKVQESFGPMDEPWQYVVYFSRAGEPFYSENAECIWGIVKEKRIKFQRMNRKKRKYEVRVSVLDRLNNESQLSKPVVIKL